MKNSPDVSVIIPTYNRVAFIEESINSVLDQKGDWKVEVIIVDDGSTDNTEEVVKRFKDKVRYFKIAHSGLPAVARNFGVRKARGELIAFQDSDDVWLPNKLNEQIKAFTDKRVVLSYGNAQVMDESGRIVNDRILPSEKIKWGESFASLLKDNVISTLTVMVRKNVFDEINGFDESPQLKAIEDYELWVRLLAKYPRGFKAISKSLATYRSHSGNISGSGALLGVERYISVFNFLWDKKILDQVQLLLLEEQLATMHENWSRLKVEAGEVPAVSVVMGIYKDELYVAEAVNSVLKQGFKNFEFIIVDDGSVDKSAEIVRKFKDERIRLIHQTNHGLVSALNKGIRLARAGIIARQDADDISLSNRFSKEFAWINARPKRALVGSYFRYFGDNKNDYKHSVIISPTKHKDLRRMMYFSNPFGHGSTMIRKQAIVEAGGYRDDYGPTEDFDLWRRIAPRWEIGQIPEVFYEYRVTAGSISHTKSKIQHRYTAKIIKELWKGPPAGKSFYSLLRDAKFYANLDSPLQVDIYNQYVSQQIRLAFEFLIHRRLYTGYKTALAALILKPSSIRVLWKTLLWSPIKYILELRI